MNEFSQGPAIYAVFYKHLLRNIFLDEMGKDLFEEFVFVANVPYRSVPQVLDDSSASASRRRDGSITWFDDVSTNQVETKNDIIRRSLSDALTELENKFGKDVKEWQWGKLHKVIFRHAFSGYSSLVDEFIDIGPFNISGDGTTLFNTEYPFFEGIKKYPRFDHEPFENTVGPAMRYIFDFAKPDEFYMILTTGQSGNLMSDHYRDMSQMWLRGGYLTIKTDEASIKRNKQKMVFRIKE